MTARLLPLVLVVLAAAPASAGPARPDAALYKEAQDAAAALRSSAKRQGKRLEWEKTVVRYRRVVARYPQSAYCDDALLAVGDLYRQMSVRFKSRAYADDAVQAYASLAAQYPSSRKAEPALYAVFDIARGRGERKRISEAAHGYLDAFPYGPRAGEMRAALKRETRTRAAAGPLPAPSAPPPPGLASVYDLRFWSGESSTRVVIDVQKQVHIRHDRIKHPDRLWIDLEGTRLHPNLSNRSFPVGDGLLEKVRIGQNREDVVRVVLDFREVKDHSIFYLDNPTRLVIDVRGSMKPMMASRSDPPVATPPSAPAAAADARAGAENGEERLPSQRLPASLPTGPSSPSPRRVASSAPVPAAPQPEAPPPPSPPRANRAGTYSLARQLGLGARRIVIDAGHGGHDPGSLGPSGLQEKELVLDVALRLAKLVRQELGAEVILTRSSDVFVPLEERTAIANSKGADLFLSIHANSSRSRAARGVETYFLNFAADAHAEAVAARENAISPATLKDLQNLVKAIALNSKVDESRDFAATVQEAMIGNLRPRYPELQDRGVRTAPFYVLIGANMPSVLAEVAFISHPDEAKLLRGQEYRQQIAGSLLEGVRAYLDALNRTPARQLTGSSRRSTVASGDAQR
ncbi:MAG TPA: N-acetylmuramoyl-L-alanine amidase [Vicinamibacteria bacterium]